MSELQREMDTFINVTVVGSRLANTMINEDLKCAIDAIPPAAKSLRAFKRLNDVTARREEFVDYSKTFSTKQEYGTLITTAFLGLHQPGEEDRDRLNSMIPGIIRTNLLKTGHYEEVTVTL